MNDSEIRKRLETLSDAELVRALVSDEYRPEAVDAAAAVLRARFPRLDAPPAADATALAVAVITALEERSACCHLCISNAVIAERFPFLLCRPFIGTPDIALTLAEIVLPGITWLRQAQYDVVPLTLNLCASCTLAYRGQVTKELCLENPLVEIIRQLYGFTEVKWPTELDDDQRSDGGPPRLGSGARVLTTAGLGVIRRITPAGQAVIDLDAGGTVTQDVNRLVAVPDEPESA